MNVKRQHLATGGFGIVAVLLLLLFGVQRIGLQNTYQFLKEGLVNLLALVGQFFQLNLLLLIITVVLSFGSHVFQKRTNLRESLEQLDDVLLGKDSKIKPVLYRFDYLPPNRAIMLEFKTYVLNAQNIGGAGEPKHPKYFVSAEHTAEGFEPEDLLEIEAVNDYDVHSTGLRLECDYMGAIQCRRVADKVMNQIKRAN